MRLVLLAHAGGSAAALPWPALLPHALKARLLPPELPGRGRRFGAPFATELRVLAGDIAATVAATADGDDVVLQGHSMGALLAYEAARALCARGSSVRGLILSGRAAPHWPAAPAGRPRHLRDDAELVEELRRLGGTPADVLAEPELLELLLPVLRADFRLVETYVWEPGPALPVPALVLGGTEDPATPLQGLDAWRQVISGPLRVERRSGGHFFHHDEPGRFAATVARQMEAWAAPAAITA